MAFVVDWEIDLPLPGGWASTDEGFDRTLPSVPGGLAVAASGAVVLAEPHADRVRWLYPAGNSATVGGTPGFRDGPATTARFRHPLGVASAADGTVFVADTGNHAIRRIDVGGTVTTVAGGISGSADGAGAAARFFDPAGLAVTAAGTVIVADTVNNTIRRIDPDGKVTTLAGSIYGQGNLGAGRPAFRRPTSAAAGTDGVIYVADSGNHRVCRIEPSGQVDLVAGRPTGGCADGDGDLVGFRCPTGLSVAPDGTLYVADSGNEAIRRVSPDGTTTTIGGEPGWRPIATGVLDDARLLVAEIRWDPFAPTARLRTLHRS